MAAFMLARLPVTVAEPGVRLTSVTLPFVRSRTKTSLPALLSIWPGRRFAAELVNVTNRPSALMLWAAMGWLSFT